MNSTAIPRPPRPTVQGVPPHRHFWRLVKQDRRKVIFRCRRCPEILVETMSDLVLTMDGDLRILVKQ